VLALNTFYPTTNAGITSGLVVGNANYASQDITDLSNPSRDARDMAQTLRQVVLK
jgi:hypothetical protein